MTGSRFCSSGAWALALALVLGGCVDRAAPRPLELWFYYATNLADPERLLHLESVWRRAAAAGYRRVVLYDPKFSRLHEMDASYFEHAARVRGLAADLGLEIVPGLFPIGRSSSLLARDPNLAEGLPIRGALFESRGGRARLVPDPPVRLPPRPHGRDPEVEVRAGVARVREHRRPARFWFRVPVSRFRSYHVAVQVRTREYTGTPLVQVLSGGKAIHFVKTLGVEPTQGWTTHHLAFNSLDHSIVTLYFGDWRPARGMLEWTDWTIEESGPFNVLRRDGAPLEAPGLLEGRDFGPVEDTLLGRTPWPGQFDDWHEPPEIPCSLREGKRFRLSWHQPAVVYNGQVSPCLSEPQLIDLLRDEADAVRQLWGARTFLMMHDEIRALNQDASCGSRGVSPGTMLAEHVRACRALLDGGEACVWSDMFDPFHNAVRDYHLVRGDLAGSWRGLGRDVVVVNWNLGRRMPSLRFFAGRGHRQVIADYYDGDPRAVGRVVAAASRIPGITGVLYATWQDRFEDLEAFAEACRRAEGAPEGARRASGTVRSPERAGSRAKSHWDGPAPQLVHGIRSGKLLSFLRSRGVHQVVRPRPTDPTGATELP